EAGQFYLIQEWIEGDTLTQKVEKSGTLSDQDVKQILVSLLPVLDYIHSRRMIHRDIKPDNVIIRQRDGLPVLIDFGAVKEAMHTQVNVPGNVPESMVIGTPGFMPAEQAAGRPTYASDLYSLGLTAIFLLTGKMPQDLQTDDRTGEFLWRQSAPNINPNLGMVLDRAIRFNARDRFTTAKEMLDALSANPLSGMDTVAVSPGGLPQAKNYPTPTIPTPTPPPTVIVGKNPAQPSTGNKPLIIGAFLAGGLLVAGVAIGVGLKRSPEPSSSIASNTELGSEQPAIEPSTLPTPSELPSQPSRSEQNLEQPVTQPPVSPTPWYSRQTAITPPPVLSESPSSPSSQVPSSQPTPSSTEQPVESPSPTTENDGSNSSESSFPGFAPGTQENYVKEMLGKPTKTTKGLWNTRAVLYEDYVPGQVSLGYLFDPSSGRLRQTEVAFAQSVEFEAISQTLDKMLNNNASAEIQQGLKQVYQRKSNRYRFRSGQGASLKGVIERNDRDRIYIGVWESDLH
ncbi:MAG TPA: serine/threonine-protein kinase, partial [Coleofasciculaceae cyanobacterium]